MKGKTKTTYAGIEEYCTKSLIDCAAISVSNKTLDITEIIDNKRDASFYEKMKVAYVFEKLGGILYYNGEPDYFISIAKQLTDPNLDRIHHYWINNYANDVIPKYGLGQLIVPQILQRYIATQREDGQFVIEKVVEGQYVPINNEVYSNEDDAKKRAACLNKNYENQNVPE